MMITHICCLAYKGMRNSTSLVVKLRGGLWTCKLVSVRLLVAALSVLWCVFSSQALA